jgi:hypothetical protein
VIALEPHLELTADQYKLKEWVCKPADRRKEYFKGIDGFKVIVRGTSKEDPLENQIVRFLMVTLESDRTFSGHIKKWKDGAKLVEKPFWAQLYETGAVLLLLEYMSACDQREWPEGEDEQPA